MARLTGPIPDVVPDVMPHSNTEWSLADGTIVYPRQVEVLWLLSHGLTKREAGERMFLAENTVRYHALTVCRALGARNVAHAVRLGLEQGLIR